MIDPNLKRAPGEEKPAYAKRLASMLATAQRDEALCIRKRNTAEKAHLQTPASDVTAKYRAYNALLGAQAEASKARNTVATIQQLLALAKRGVWL